MGTLLKEVSNIDNKKKNSFLFFSLLILSLFSINTFAANEINISTAANNNLDIGLGVTGYEKAQQTFNSSTAVTIGGVYADLWKVNTPTDSIKARLETVSGGNATGTLVCAGAGGEVAAASLAGTAANYTLTFNSSCTIAAYTTYAIVFMRKGGSDGTN